MADRYFVNGGVDSNWGTSGNWSTTSGGAGGASVPTNADDAYLDGNSPTPCTMTGAGKQCLSLNTTGWTGTLDLDATTLTCSANITLSATTTVTGTFNLASNATGNLTSNGVVVPFLLLSGSSTKTLLDNWTVSDTLTLGSTTASTVINGFKITCQKNLTTSGSGNGGSQSGTTVLEMTGTGTLSTYNGTNSRIGCPLTINTAGTITLGSALCYGGATFTYTAGTVVTTGSTLIIQQAAATLDLEGITFNNVQLQGALTHTISSPISMTGLLTIGSTTGATVVDGSSITTTGGIAYGGTTGICTGTTQLIANGTQSLTDPTRTTGHLRIPLRLNAPGGTITVSSGFPADFGSLEIIDGTTVTTATGTFKVAGTVAA